MLTVSRNMTTLTLLPYLFHTTYTPLNNSLKNHIILHYYVIV
ncbi:hypothetical protein PP653_gp027 [Bacillus phage Basilisk]|uniref:Uncharacterized protein n=1 Tax=Bacillus phage Basilisk TaxID=1296654 RepID=S5MM18_9CAUD|nr:hypothetical protein PP653_gp027 [Bacillus phage Basilisk]AGR46710.2 hypothetical protein BASILISK_140 [Bacillus phage Basilisk]